MSLNIAEKLCKKLRGKSDLTAADRIRIAIHIEHRRHEVDMLIQKAAAKDTEIEGWRKDQKENLRNQCDLHAELTSLRAAAQQAMEALEDCVPVIPNGIAYEHSQTVITALTAALKGANS